jgi:hypothetical protein
MQNNRKHCPNNSLHIHTSINFLLITNLKS